MFVIHLTAKVMDIDRRIAHIKRVEAVRKTKIRLATMVLSFLFLFALVLVIVNAGRAEEGIGAQNGEADFESVVSMEDRNIISGEEQDTSTFPYSKEYGAVENVDEGLFASEPIEPISSEPPVGPEIRIEPEEQIGPVIPEVEFQLAEEDHWKLLLVNWENPVPDDFETRLYYVEGNFLIDHRVVDPLRNMFAAMREEGLSPLLVSAHRCRITQTTLFENNVTRNMVNNMTREEAEREAARVVAAPGTSEHEIGLAVDIVATHYQNLTESFAWTPEGIWMANYSANFGFILRYPRNTEDITGIIFEPWHLRYVGVEVARYITENNITLEEFLKKYFP